MKIVAVDPGKMTGVAWTTEEGVLSCELPAMEAVQKVGFLWRISGGLDRVIVEDFVPRRGQALTWQPDALHVIGALRYMARQRRFPMILQRPIPKQRQLGLERELRERGWWSPTKGGHENAARKHLLMFLQKEGDTWTS